MFKSLDHFEISEVEVFVDISLSLFHFADVCREHWHLVLDTDELRKDCIRFEHGVWLNGGIAIINRQVFQREKHFKCEFHFDTLLNQMNMFNTIYKYLYSSNTVEIFIYMGN